MRHTILLTLGAAATVATGEPAPDPAAVLKTIEAPVLKCKTLRTDVAVSIVPEALGSLKGTLVVGAGNKVRLELDGSVAAMTGKTVTVCDGERVRSVGFTQKAQDRPAEKQLGEMMRASHARVGVFVPLFLATKAPEPGEPRTPFALDTDYPVSGLKLGPALPGRDTRAVEYTVSPRGSKAAFDVVTWADAKTHLPVRRGITLKEAGKTVVVTETYSNTVLDGPVADGEFALPK